MEGGHSARTNDERRGVPRGLTLLVLILLAGFAGYQLASRDGSPAHVPASPSPVASLDDRSVHPPDIDPAALVTIHSEDDTGALTQKLAGIIWGRSSLPDTLPAVEPSFLDDAEAERYHPHARSIETLATVMDGGIVTRALHFSPREGNGTVVILHDGHDESFLSRRVEIVTLLEHGFGVVGMSMPLVSPNEQPEVTLPSGERIRLRWHDQLKYLHPASGHPVQYLLEPVIQVVNHLGARGGYERTAMLGISGGGWTTVMAAAIDSRITVSIPVAGSFPVYMRSLNERDWGDWEETLPEIFDSISYLDLYVLGSSGCGRRQVQIYYELDPCCYAGTAPLAWKTPVDTAARTLSGSFDVVIDASYRRHGYSKLAMETAISELGRRPETPCR